MLDSFFQRLGQSLTLLGFEVTFLSSHPQSSRNMICFLEAHETLTHSRNVYWTQGTVLRPEKKQKLLRHWLSDLREPWLLIHLGFYLKQFTCVVTTMKGKPPHWELDCMSSSDNTVWFELVISAKLGDAQWGSVPWWKQPGSKSQPCSSLAFGIEPSVFAEPQVLHLCNGHKDPHLLTCLPGTVVVRIKSRLGLLRARLPHWVLVLGQGSSKHTNS